jgi:hypothetical protein
MQITLSDIKQLHVHVHAAVPIEGIELCTSSREQELPLGAQGPRLVKLDERGNELPWDTQTFAILRHEPAGLLIDLRRVHSGNHESCLKFASESTLLGRKWRLGTVEEIFLHVADRTRQDPAVDPDIYPMLRSEWIWTRTPDAKPTNPSSPDFAWGVLLAGGLADLYYRRYGGLALPVSPLVAPAGQ